MCRVIRYSFNMEFRSLILFLGLLVSVSAFSTLKKLPELVPFDLTADYGTPLFLTPYIEAGQLTEAKSLSLVGPLAGTTRQSYTGYLTVDPNYNSNLFFWYFPAEENQATAPVVVWLQGGPGSSSMFGLFGENGPFVIDSEYNLHDREINWGTPFNLLYFDNPVGTGFSFTDDDAGYANNQTDVAEDLYEGIIQFLTLFSELQANDFYVTGESYGGKYVPAIAYKIHMANPTASLKINLKGIAIGDGWIDPESQFDYGDYLYNVGLLDKQQLQLFYDQQLQMVSNIQAGNWAAASTNSDNMVPGMYRAFTHIIDYYNYLRIIEPVDQNYYYNYLQKPEVRSSIHTGNLTFNDGSAVYDHLSDDVCKSTKSWLEEILDNDYKVMLYNGQVDVICAYYLGMNMVYTMQWKGATDYRQAKRIIWKVDPADNEIAGYVKQSDNFWEVMVRNAGHILPYDQPRVAYDLITRFVFDQPFEKKH